MIPAYDFSPVGEGVTFLPKGNREGSCARSRLHDSTDLECRGACLLRRSRANPSAVAGPGLREARRSRTATSPNPVPVSLYPGPPVILGAGEFLAGCLQVVYLDAVGWCGCRIRVGGVEVGCGMEVWR